MRAAKCATMFAVLMMLGSVVFAQEPKMHREGRHARHPVMMDPSEMVIAPDVYKLNLTEDQKTKLEALKNEYAPKLKAGFEKHTSILTDEQRKARQDAVKAAKEAGKTRQEVWKEAQAAVKLTDAQKAQMDKAREEGQTLRKEIHEKVMAVLTPEQREQLKKERQQHRGPKQAEPQKTT